MQTYHNCHASRKLNNPGLKSCWTFRTPAEIAKLLNGYLNCEWINIRGPHHSSKDRSLGIKFDKNERDGFTVYSFAGDDPQLCRAYVNQKLEEIGNPFPIRRQTPRGTETIAFQI